MQKFRVLFVAILTFGLAAAGAVPAQTEGASLTFDPSVPAALPDWSYRGGINGERLGHSVASAGDVNGDGYDDVLIGAPKQKRTVDREGVVHLFWGSPGGLSSFPDWSAAGGQQGTDFGTSVAWAGDLNGDGYDDVIIGAPYYNGPTEVQVGAVFVYLGGPVGLGEDPDQVLMGLSKSEFGFSVGGVGDVNGDGLDDVIVGAPLHKEGGSSVGAAFVFLGTDAPGLVLEETPIWEVVGTQAGCRLGASVGGAGDVNGDGYADIIVGAPSFTQTADKEGAAYVFHGSDSGPNANPDWTAYGGQAGGQFGYSVGTAGHINGDGSADVIVGAPYWDDGPTLDVGAAFAYTGSAAGVNAGYSWMAVSDQASSRFGISVGRAGDLNGDGLDEVIVGASRYTGRSPDDSQRNEGVAFIFFGSTLGLWPEPRWRVEGNKADTEFGFSVGTAGDVNGDGFDDFVVGAPNYKQDDKTPGGRAFGYYGPYFTSWHAFLPAIVRSTP